ncbi:alpha/beta hydrolase [Pedobacter chitinilyticus]|uniref:Esterase n=1 Tax=Pedobacter chitinilyticus TaxID=2233776 RepID=A0A443YZZ5_9SPHI|nr:alpha/beta hydrolase-fold protein [Pedobacter chitinilyticus]RWU09852.1 hypothetical protein DPV69_00460 [Pedobacter chitinilyticus]
MIKILKISLWVFMITTNAYAQNVIKVQLDTSLKGPYTGRLIVYLQSDTSKAFGASKEEWPSYAINVINWKTGTLQVLDKTSDSYPKVMDALPKGYYKMVATLDTNTKERSYSAPGNLYTKFELVAKLDSGQTKAPVLTLTHVTKERKFVESTLTKEVVLKSELLTKFRKEAIFMKAGIVLPASYESQPQRKFPVVYVIPGWTGNHHQANSKSQHQAYGVGEGQEKIFVFLNPETQTPFGLHAFVDSRVNGPWGSALINELIPYLESQFRISKTPEHRLITGQSSGGYGAIWLALHFPEKFGGCWATSPDPVDFSSFTGVDIYQDENYFYDRNKMERGIDIFNGKPKTTLRNTFVKEQVDGDGGQQQSFEAAFGLPDHHGRPQALFDPTTGKINKMVANSWRPYDLALYVQQNWPKIKHYVDQKIRIYVGENDNYLLQHSALMFEKKIKTIGAGIQVQMIKNADHFNTRLMVTRTIQKEMDETIESIK